jgi:MFS family permease
MKIVDNSGGNAGRSDDGDGEAVLDDARGERRVVEPKGLAFVLRALRSRNYRLFFAGQLVSMVGNWLTSVATSWLVYRLTGSAVLLGLVGFAGQFPAFLVSPFAGVLVDRWPLRRTLVITQTLAMLESFALAGVAFAFSRHLLETASTIRALLALNLCQGLINAVDIPARQAFVVEMVDRREDLANAIALNSSLVNAARLLGPSIGGVLIALFGEGWCYLIDGISYIGVIIALLMMTVRPGAPRRQHDPVLQSLREGFRFSFGFAPIRYVLTLLALVSLAGVPYMVLMPIFAREILHGGPRTLGILMGGAGIGALAGAIYLASRRTVLGLGAIIGFAAITFGAGLVVFSFSRSLWLSLALMPITGGSMIIQMAGSNTILQTLVDDHMRGRVMAFFTMCFMGMIPLGSLLSGALATHIGAPRTVMCGGLICILGGATFLRARPHLRKLVEPIYIKRGILPQVAVGIRDADVATQNVAG